MKLKILNIFQCFSIYSFWRKQYIKYYDDSGNIKIINLIASSIYSFNTDIYLVPGMKQLC